MKKTLKIVSSFFLATTLFIGCEKDAEIQSRDYPFITTQVSSVNNEGVELEAKILNFGTENIDEYGFVWSYDDNSTQLEFIKKIGTNLTEEEYNYSVRSGLIKDSDYNVRSYLKTNNHIIYGNTVSFKSEGSLAPKIMSFSPEYGPIGTEIEIDGENFALSKNANIVKFGDIVVNVDSITENKLFVSLPDDITEPDIVNITVETAGMIATSDKSFSIWYPWLKKTDYTSVDYQSTSFSIGNIGYIINRNSQNLLAYNPETETWTDDILLPENSGETPLTFVNLDKAYVILANGFWEYDPSTNTWTKKSDFPGGSTEYMYSFSDDDNGYVGDCHKNKNLWKYVFSTDEWIQMSDFPGGYYAGDPPWGYFYFTVNNCGYIGVNRAGVLKQFWEYNFLTGDWTEKATYPQEAHSNFCSFVIEDYAFIGLGYLQNGSAGAVSDKIWRYNPESDSWTSYHNCTKTLASYASFSINDKAYVMGVNTYYDRDDTKYIYEFDPSKN